MARKGIIQNKKGKSFLRLLLISGLISALYFISGILLASDTGPMWTFYFYFPIIIIAFAVGYGGGSDSRLYTLIAIEFIILWVILLILLLIIRFILNLIKEIRAGK